MEEKGRKVAMVWFLFLSWFFPTLLCFSLWLLSSSFPVSLSLARILFAKIFFLGNVYLFLKQMSSPACDGEQGLSTWQDLEWPRRQTPGHVYEGGDWTDWGWNNVLNCVLQTGILGVTIGKKDTKYQHFCSLFPLCRGNVTSCPMLLPPCLACPDGLHTVSQNKLFLSYVSFTRYFVIAMRKNN